MEPVACACKLLYNWELALHFLMLRRALGLVGTKGFITRVGSGGEGARYKGVGRNGDGFDGLRRGIGKGV